MTPGKEGTAVLFLIFNRPDTTKRVFEAIKAARPPRLYVAADGPRPDRSGEAEKCAQARLIVEEIDWPCEVLTLFRDVNLGCRNAVSGAITWFFQQEEEGIILEDDCLPGPSFFHFCQLMLEKYRHSPQIMHIGGNNFLSNETDVPEASHYFSRFNHIWGWATWRRAWEKYDPTLRTLPIYLQSNITSNQFGSNFSQYYWLVKFIDTYHGKIDTWDYQWTFCIWRCNGLSITPDVNLVSNIGFNQQATHVVRDSRLLGNRPVAKVALWKDVPASVNTLADDRVDLAVFGLGLFKKLAMYLIYRFKLFVL
ncbi:MAG TPA: glycosyltransferase family 2 protein [Bacteroidia bacterium]|nr:glycosyltransferase family 2 protein [Bacteroidia bacterium]